MYKITDKTTGNMRLIEEKDIGKMFRPGILENIYDRLDNNQTYENESVKIENNH